MSTFLTPPVWYGGSGEEDKSLVNTKTYAAGGPDNTPFGYLAVAGNPNGDSFGAVAIGCQAQATASKAIAIGSYDENGTSRDVIAAGTGSIAIGAGAKVEATGGMAIGTGSSALEGGIAIGESASASGNMIQIGNPSTRYDLKIGNGNFSLVKGSTAQNGGNWISITSDGISEGLYLVRYGGGTHMNVVYLMAPITITEQTTGTTSVNDWYFPYSTGEFPVTVNSVKVPVDKSYYLKVDKTSTSSNLKIIAGSYTYNSSQTQATFTKDTDATAYTYLFRIL